MKLNPSILTTTIALLTSAAFAAEAESKSESNFNTVTSGKTGKATITIDVNGKKETREIDLGSGTEIKVTTINKDGDSIVVGDGETIVTGGVRKAYSLKSKPVTWLGVALQPISEELSAQLPIEPGTGVVVGTILPDSPAQKAGLQKNDVLTKIDDSLVSDLNQVRELIAAKKDGEMVKVTYFRKGQQNTLDVKLTTHLETDVAENKWLSKLGNSGSFLNQSRALILDKDGKVMASNNVEHEAVEKLVKALREAKIDDKLIDQATRSLKETTAVIRDAMKDAGIAQQEVQKRSPEMEKALTEFLSTIDRVRKQTVDAVKKERVKRDAERDALEKQP